MRKVFFPKNGVLKEKLFGSIYKLKSENNSFYAELEPENSYIFDGEEFYCLKGFGDIEYNLFPKHAPNFEKINLENLDYFIQNDTHSATNFDEIAQIEEFIKMFDLNTAQPLPLLYTKSYNNLFNQLLGYRNERYTYL